jgi:hypothetical protein
MATTTTNYGFDVPTSSDLVKNGATQIALLGQDLDTFLFRPFTRNLVLNSSFNVWQRGTTFTNPINSTTYAADRWSILAGASGYTYSRQSSGLTGFQYCMRAARDSGSSSANNVWTTQGFETSNSIPFAGQTVTFSFYARAGANFSATSNNLSVRLFTGTGTDQNVLAGFTGSATPINTTATLTTSWQRFSYTVTLASNITQLGVGFFYLPTGTAGAADYYEVTGVTLEVGSQASPYAAATPTYATELAACQRYYYRESGDQTISTGFGQAYSTTNFYSIFKPKVTMRRAPTAIDYLNLGAGNAISLIAVTSASLWSQSTADAPAILCTTGGTFVATTPWAMQLTGVGYIGFSAEL